MKDYTKLAEEFRELKGWSWDSFTWDGAFSFAIWLDTHDQKENNCCDMCKKQINDNLAGLEFPSIWSKCGDKKCKCHNIKEHDQKEEKCEHGVKCGYCNRLVTPTELLASHQSQGRCPKEHD